MREWGCQNPGKSGSCRGLGIPEKWVCFCGPEIKGSWDTGVWICRGPEISSLEISAFRVREYWEHSQDGTITPHEYNSILHLAIVNRGLR